MKIVSNFVDFYDLQNSMDDENTWYRDTTISVINTAFPKGYRAIFKYLNTYYYVKDKNNMTVGQSFGGDHENDPLVLFIPLTETTTRVVVNPSLRQYIGLAALDQNAYRLHLEIEMFLKGKGLI